MKKLAVFFIVLISLVVVAGCNHSKKTVTRFSSDDEDNGTKTTVTTIDNGDKVEPDPIELTDSSDTSDSTKSVKEEVKFTVTSPSGKIMNTDKGYHLIQGTTPSTTDEITINGRKLSKYKAGETQWNYIAAASLGTLQKGRNYYKVIAFDDNGKELASENFTIVYKGIENGSLVDTGFGSWIYALIITCALSLGFLYSRSPKQAEIRIK